MIQNLDSNEMPIRPKQLPQNVKQLIDGLQKLRTRMVVDKNHAAKYGPAEAVPLIESYFYPLQKLLEPWEDSDE